MEKLEFYVHRDMWLLAGLLLHQSGSAEFETHAKEFFGREAANLENDSSCDRRRRWHAARLASLDTPCSPEHEVAQVFWPDSPSDKGELLQRPWSLEAILTSVSTQCHFLIRLLKSSFAPDKQHDAQPNVQLIVQARALALAESWRAAQQPCGSLQDLAECAQKAQSDLCCDELRTLCSATMHAARVAHWLRLHRASAHDSELLRLCCARSTLAAWACSIDLLTVPVAQALAELPKDNGSAIADRWDRCTLLGFYAVCAAAEFITNTTHAGLLELPADGEVLYGLSGVKQLCASVFPLSLRLDVLEAIFALLFVRSEDLRNECRTDDDGMRPSRFLCDEGAIQAVSAVLRDALAAARAASFQMRSREDPVRSRIDRLSQCVSEAGWRLALLGPPPPQPWSIRVGQVEPLTPPSAADWPSCAMTRMLASPSSLVTSCLAVGDLSGARTVLQTCGLESTRLAAEVRFAEAHRVLRSDLRAAQAVRTSTTQTRMGGSATLQAIRRAAEAGVESAGPSGVLEHFLSATPPESAEFAAWTATDAALTAGRTAEQSEALWAAARHHGAPPSDLFARCAPLPPGAPSLAQALCVPGPLDARARDETIRLLEAVHTACVDFARTLSTRGDSHASFQRLLDACDMCDLERAAGGCDAPIYARQLFTHLQGCARILDDHLPPEERHTVVPTALPDSFGVLTLGPTALVALLTLRMNTKPSTLDATVRRLRIRFDVPRLMLQALHEQSLKSVCSADETDSAVVGDSKVSSETWRDNEFLSCSCDEPLPLKDLDQLLLESNKLLAAASSPDLDALQKLLSHLADTKQVDDTSPMQKLDQDQKTSPVENAVPVQETDTLLQTNLGQETNLEQASSRVQGYETQISTESSTEAQEAMEGTGPVPAPVVTFLEAHCWLAARLVLREGKCAGTEPRTECARRLLSTDGAALNTDRALLWTRLMEQAENADFPTLLCTLRALPVQRLRADPALGRVADAVHAYLALQPSTADSVAPWLSCERIHDADLRRTTVLSGLRTWPAAASLRMLRALLDLPAQTDRESLLITREQIDVYSQIAEVVGESSWLAAQALSETSPAHVLRQLVDGKQRALCLRWLRLREVASNAPRLMDVRLLEVLVDVEPPDFDTASQLLRAVVPAQAASVLAALCDTISSPKGLAFAADLRTSFCTVHESPAHRASLLQLQVGARMLKVRDTQPKPEPSANLSEREPNPADREPNDVKLAAMPWLLLEQALMNGQLDALERMLNATRVELERLPVSSPVSVANVDALLRRYAAKALDFRVEQAVQVPVAPPSPPPAPSEPAVSRDQWVPNDQVTECMCCRVSSFSMFNRRHHCRHCGRVVCRTCSPHRMKVQGYGGVAVRVCIDCACSAEPTGATSGTVDKGSVRSASLESAPAQWRLRGEAAHDETVREEFAFEQAPSVALCLAILRLHSEQTAYPRFLLDAADKMLGMLRPANDGIPNREVDHDLVIRMVRSLVLAAKVTYARAGLDAGCAHCDARLSAAELRAQLLRTGCCAHVPRGLRGLRTLRDALACTEQWRAAMDVATKAGLDCAGVWAAWGKAELRAGRFLEARARFKQCLEQVGDAHPRPAHNPALVDEIVRILESCAEPPEAACADGTRGVEHSLRSLEQIASGSYPRATSPAAMVMVGCRLDDALRAECLHYLRSYGSHAALLRFHLAHGELAQALSLCANRPPALFAENLLAPSLRRTGAIDALLIAMRAYDPTMSTWQPHLELACAQLARAGRLHLLYELQLRMRDLVRAAITCTRFYCAGARSYRDLHAHLGHLHRAQAHLEAELAARKDPSCTAVHSPGSARRVERHLQTVQLQADATRILALHDGDGEDEPPTLFGEPTAHAQLATLLVLHGGSEGVSVAQRVVVEHGVPTDVVYGSVGRILGTGAGVEAAAVVASCLRSAGQSEACNILLRSCLAARAECPEPGNVEPLVRMLNDPDEKIAAYIACRQLKSAYLLAVKLHRMDAVRTIHDEAQRLAQPAIRQICAARLRLEPQL